MMSIMKQGGLLVVAGFIACSSRGTPARTNTFMQGAGALLAPMPCTVATIEQNTAIFTDRTFLFHAPPANLKGQPFLCASIQGELPVQVIRDGLLTVITPDSALPQATCSRAAELERAGFIWIQSPATFQCFGSNAIDRCRIYQKRVAAGEQFTLKKWAIYAGFDPQGQSFYTPNARVQRVIDALKTDTNRVDALALAQDIQVNRPDYVVFIPRQPRDKTKRDPARPGDTYNDHFQVIEHTGKLFAFWTQASREADIDQHIAFSISRDHGETWSDPIILAGSHSKKIPGLLASWQQPMFSKSGRIYLLWNQQTTSRGPHCGQMFGFYSDDEGATWSSPKMVPMQRMSRDPEDPLIPPSWCNWQRPLRLGKENRYLVGVSRHGKLSGEQKGSCTVEFLQFDNIDDNPAIENIKLSWFATNEHVLKVEHEKFGSACEEAALVKLPDGRLFTLMRTCAGHPFWSQSRDHGATWTQPKPLRDRDGGTPYLHPRSPCPLYDWKGPEAGSGYYFALVHNTFDFAGEREYQKRGPLYLFAGRFNPQAEQPIEFAAPQLFAPRENGNSFYTSYTVVDGKGILWFPDTKFYLLGREIDETWFHTPSVVTANTRPASTPANTHAPTSSVPVIVNMAADGVVNFVYAHFRKEGTNRVVAEAALDAEVDQYQGSGVSHLFWNVNYQRVGYNSTVWPSYWDVPNPEKQVTDWPRTYYLLHTLGLDDIFSRLIPRTRAKGLSPWISLRMDDHHYFNDPSRISPLLQNHPELRTHNGRGLFNYAKPEVRAHYMNLIRDVLERYDCDGIELDWLRSPDIFEDNELEQGRRILTTFVREAAEQVRSATARRGHPVKLAVRVPATPEFARGKGMDAVAWARAGLIDMLIVADWWNGCADIPIERWRAEIGPLRKPCTFIAGTASTYACTPKSFQFVHTIPSQRGFTASMLDRGADGIYLFNHFHAVSSIQRLRTPEGKSVTDGTLGELFRAAADRQGASTHRRIHPLAYHDCLPKKTDYVAPLAKVIGTHSTPAAFRLHIGPQPATNAICRLYIGLGATNGVESAQFSARVNTHACHALSELARPTKEEYRKPQPDSWMTPPRRNLSELAARVLVFDVPAATLLRGYNAIDLIQTRGSNQIITWLELECNADNP